MRSFMARDNLGRIVYEGDIMGDGMRIARLGLGLSYTIPCAIDISASPEHTNYERYFADLGSRGDVIEAFDLMWCPDACRGDVECPFEALVGDCNLFTEWLDEKAVV